MEDFFTQTLGDQVEQTRIERARLSLSSAMDTNPDNEARIVDLSRRAGLPQDTVSRNLPAVQKGLDFESVDFGALASKSPRVLDWLGDPENSRVAHDDIDALSALEESFSGARWYDYPGALLGGAVQSVGSTLAGPGDAIKTAAENAAGLVPGGAYNLPEVAALGLQSLAGSALEMTGEAIKSAGGLVMPPQERQNLGTQTLGAVGQLATQIPVFLLGGPAASVAFSSAQMMDAGSQAAEDKGMDGTQAEQDSALVYGAIGALTETPALGLWLKGVPDPVKREVSKRIGALGVKLGVKAEGLAASLGKTAAGRLALKAGEKTASAGTALAVEGTQEAFQQYLQNISDALVLQDDKPLGSGVFESGVVGGGAGAIANVLLGLLPGSAARVRVDMETQVAQSTAQSLDAQIDALSATKTNARSIRKTRELVEILAAKQPVRFDGAAAPLFQSLPDEVRNDLYDAVPGLREGVETAAATGADILLPRSDFLTRVPADLAKTITPLAKAHPEGISAQDAADPEKVAAYERLFQTMAETPPAEKTSAARRAAIEKNILSAFDKTALYTKDQTRQIARMAAASYDVLYGENAEKAFAADTLRVERGNPDTGPEAMGQIINIFEGQAFDPEREAAIVEGIVREEFSHPPKSYERKAKKYVQTDETGKISTRMVVSVAARLPVALRGDFKNLYIGPGGVLYEGIGNKDAPLRPAADTSIRAAQSAATDIWKDVRAKNAARLKIYERDALELAEYIDSKGIDAKIVNPDDTESRYVYFSYNGQEYKIRFSRHGQPTQGVVMVGGYSRTMKKRFPASNLSVDPESGLSMDSAKAYVDDVLSGFVSYDGGPITISAMADLEDRYRRGPNPFYQSSGPAAAASLTALSGGRYLMRLGQSADRSSALHEMAHMFLFQMRDGARADWLTPQGKEVWAGFQDYFREHAADVAAEANAIAKRRGLDTVVTEDDVRAMIDAGMNPVADVVAQGEVPAPVATLTGTELGDFGGDVKALRAAAKAFYKDKLQGTSVQNPALGTIRIGSGRKTFSASADPRKIKLFPALKEILSSARLVESVPAKDPSIEGATKAYHWLVTEVSLEGKTERIGLTVREDTNGNFYYNHTLDAKRGFDLPSEARSGPALKAGGGTSEGGETPLFQNIPQDGDGVNIHILPMDGGAGAPPGATDAQRLAYEGLHEVFARSFEGYLREGKAPSRRLRDTFRMFKRWLSAIYRSLKELRIDLNPEIAALFDRMLASDAEIAAAQGRVEFAPMTDEAMDAIGLSPEQKDAYRRASERARGDAEDSALGAYMADLDREDARTWEDELVTVKEETRAAMRKERDWNALAVLTGLAPAPEMEGGGNFKIDASALKEGWPPEIVGALNKKRLRGREWVYAKDDGLPPDVIADLLGFGSGDEMIRRLATIRPFEDEVSERADAQMKRRHGTGKPTPGRVQEILRSDSRARMLGEELRLIGEKAGMGDMSLNHTDARAAADAILSRMPVRDAVEVDRYIRAERTAALEAMEALSRGDAGSAFGAKRRQVSNYYLYDAALRAAEGRDRFFRRMEGIIRKKNDKLPNIDGDYADLIRMILNYTGVLRQPRPQPAGAVAGTKLKIPGTGAEDATFTPDDMDPEAMTEEDQIQADIAAGARRPGQAAVDSLPSRVTGKDILGQIAAEGRMDPEDVSVIQADITALTAKLGEKGVPDWRAMAWDDWSGIMDLAETIAALGRERRGFVVDGEKRTIVGLASDIIASLRRAKKVGRVAVDPNAPIDTKPWRFQDSGFGFGGAVLSLYSGLRRMESWINSIEGHDPTTPLHRAHDMVKEGVHAYRDDSILVGRQLEPIARKIAGRLGGKKNHSPELYGDFTRGEIIGMMLHMGSDSNFDKLVRGMSNKWREDRGLSRTDSPQDRWTRDGVERFIARMAVEGVLIKSDMDAVQEAWDLFESLKPRAQAVHKQRFGRRFDEIPARPLATPWGGYRGGYYPAAVDMTLVKDVKVKAQLEAIQKEKGLETRPATRKGFTMTREQAYAAPLDLNPARLVSHIETELKFIHLSLPISRAARVFGDRGVKETLNAFDRDLLTGTINPWLSRAADLRHHQSTTYPALDTFVNGLRSRAAQGVMFLNIVNTLQQPANLIPAAKIIGRGGAIETARGTRYLGSALAAYMRDRAGLRAKILAASGEYRHRANVFIDESVRGDAQRMLSGEGISLDNTSFQNIQAGMKQAGSLGARYAYVLQTALQAEQDAIVWLAAYDRYMADRGGDENPGSYSDREAIAHADEVLRSTQVSMNPEDLSRVEVNFPLVRLLMMFGGWFNGMMNTRNAEIMYLYNTKGKTAATIGALFVFFATSLWPYLLGQMAFDLFKDDLPYDKDGDGTALDDWAAYVPMSVATTAAGEIPGVGNIGRFAWNVYKGDTYGKDLSIFQSPAQTQVVRAFQAPGLALDAATGDGDLSRAVSANLVLFQMIFGLPVAGQIARTGGYLADVYEGDVAPQGPADWGRGIIGGTPAKK